MDSGLLRVLILAALFLLLAGDFSFILEQVSGVFSVSDTKVRDDKHKENIINDNSLEIAGKNARVKLMTTMKNVCLPKLICELNSVPHKEKLTESEKSLLALISDTTISSTAEVTSRYHFAAHMGQLIAGIDGTGCHNFYPSCPFPGLQVLNMIKSIRFRS